jgi:hypothetical protein
LLATEMVAIDQLEPWDKNPRMISEHDQQSLIRSVTEFGMVEPLVARKSDNRVIGGHQRLQVAQTVGLKEVPVVWVEVDDDRAVALNLALNRISGEWEQDTLRTLLDELVLDDDLLALSGFTEQEWGDLVEQLTVPTLDKLGDQYGPGSADDFWPTISVRVPNDVKELFDRLMAAQPEENEAMKFKGVLDRANHL